MCALFVFPLHFQSDTCMLLFFPVCSQLSISLTSQPTLSFICTAAASRPRHLQGTQDYLLSFSRHILWPSDCRHSDGPTTCCVCRTVTPVFSSTLVSRHVHALQYLNSSVNSPEDKVKKSNPRQ